MDVFKDKRFSAVVKDPRFKKIPEKHVKTKVDKRFQGLLNSKQFKLRHIVDKRGSPLDHKISEDYRRFYTPDGDECDTQAENASSKKNECKKDREDECTNDADAKSRKDTDEECQKDTDEEECRKDTDEEECKKDTDEESDEDHCREDEDEKNSMTRRMPESESISDDDDDDSTSSDTETSDDEQDEELDHHWQELDADAPRSTDVTHRLAICNMDWDRIHADDFLVVFNSFKPPEGVIHSTKIYPSEYGLERMEKEKLNGPAELIESKLDCDEENATSDTKGSRFHQEKLRQYQINRLKYFFGVVDCDSPKTADALYDHLNGMEFENSGCVLDLRFIPDEMIFEQEPMSVSTSLSCPSDYKPVSFVTSALNQVRVDLTWDETDPRRKEVLEKAFTDPESIEKDLKEYLASPSESEDEMEELQDTVSAPKLSTKEAIAKYRELIKAFGEKEKGKENEEEFDMEITWDTGLKENTEKLVKEKTLEENLTPFEETLRKKKELKKLKKERKLKSKEAADNSSSEELELEESEDDMIQKKDTLLKGSKRNKLKLQEKSKMDEKEIAELTLLMADRHEKHFSDSDDSSEKIKKRKKKKKKGEEKKEESFVGYVDDPRFAAMYTSPMFHIDPSDPKFKESKIPQAFIEAIQRKKYGNASSAIVCDEIPKEKADFVRGSKDEVQKSVRVEALKEKLAPFCTEFQRKKDKNLSKQQRLSQAELKERHSALMPRTSLETSSEGDYSRKRKKQKKIGKQKFSVDDISDQVFSTDATALQGSSTSAQYFGEIEDSDISIFSGGGIRSKQSAFSSESPCHGNSIKKKVKKFRVS